MVISYPVPCNKCFFVLSNIFFCPSPYIYYILSEFIFQKKKFKSVHFASKMLMLFWDLIGSILKHYHHGQVVSSTWYCAVVETHHLQ
jgi:hypothetical protein